MIPGVETFHPRDSWQHPDYPIDGPADDLSNNDTVVIHYTAADDLIDGDPGEHAEDLPDYLRAMQRYYVDARGYSVGYLFAVDWLGGVWQLRGWDFQSAANRGHNGHTVPILVLVDGNDPATPEAVQSVRNIVAEAERLSRRPMKIVGHGQLSGASTSCPGLGLGAQVSAGVFTPQPPPIPVKAATMIAIDYQPGTPEWTAMVYTGTHLAHVYNSHADSVLRAAKVERVEVGDSQLDGLIRSAKTTTPAPPAWRGTERGALWETRRA